ncbi:replication endonuclease [Thalassotalea castellviae]|uniref:Replication endonuclease n=1 Tax=Thalassotalea castellviae TaxID=3075612 RepID=A0ABU3A7T3_9GAMM|nr:replication endonuclease [Thalassotalea sp. W431]MDT0605041.1 replication endonuclease [Thalassotalea sp. W431]
MTAQNNVLELKFNKIASVFKDYPFLAEERHECAADRADVNFIFEQLNKVPDVIKRIILNKAFKLKARRERNLYILNTTKMIVGLLPEKLRHSLTVDDEEIRVIAQDCADRCRRMALHHNVNGNFRNEESAYNEEFRNVTKRLDPLTDICESNASEILRILTDYAETFRIKAVITSGKGVTELGTIKRMCDLGWWNRRLRKIFNQAYEQAAIELNLVQKYKQIYASDLTVKKRKQQKTRNEQMLSSMTVINDIGQQYSLKELSDLNVSNPTVRKAELMVRMRGFEELSKSHNHQGVFITITCPSKYHAAFAKSGQRNPKYEGFTPYQANQYLCKVWSRIRAELDRKGIKPYGFRVAEPQHDGTPHWHMLLFVEKHHIELLQSIIRHYALEEDGDEKGAQENRCDFKLIDPKKGSATGYIAKYVSKNIDGEGLDKGVYGEDPITAAQRVDAWSSCWCIRQFQQIGGASVSVWRELRRLKQKLALNSVVEKARVAADESKWDDFINAMGGVFSRRKDQPLKLAYDASFNSETGECKLGHYDGNIIQTIKGIYYQGQMILTRFFSWRLERANVVCDNLEFCK